MGKATPIVLLREGLAICGIAGWVSWDEKVHPKVSTIHSMLRANQTRGQDAAGIAYLKGGEVYRRKAPITANKLIETLTTPEWEEISHSPIGLLHTRAQTKGSSKQNTNNHPVSGFGWLVVHNGMIMNDDDLYDYYKAERFAEVDTAAIPLVLSRGETLDDQIKQITTLGGSATFAAWQVSAPRRVILARLGHNELYMFLDPVSKILYFSSAAVFAKAMPTYALGSLRFLTIHKLADDKVVVLDLDNPTRTFKVTRRPFYHYNLNQKKVTSPTKTSGDGLKDGLKIVSSHVEPEKISITKTDGDRTYKMSWYLEDKKKPVADTARIGYNPMILISEECRCRAAPTPAWTVLTAYGRWKFRKSVAKIEREFKPRRAIRKWWRTSLKMKNVNLPVEINTSNLYDGKQAAESFIVGVADSQGSEVQIPGFMCPWCGVTNRSTSWVTNKWRCEFCRIASWPRVVK